MKNKNLISDEGVVQKTNYIDVSIITVCSVVSLVLVVLGALAYLVG